MKHYQTLEKVFQKLNDIDQAKSVLHWDMAVHMPAGGAEARSEQLATLSDVSHAIITDRGIKSLLEGAASEKNTLDAWQVANLREMKRRWQHATAVPQRLVSDLTRAGAECEMVWRKARAENDFKSFAPHLKKVVGITREIAKAKGAALGCSPYDALLDQYDPGRTSAQVDVVFKDLEAFLPEFTGQVLEKQRSQGEPLALEGSFPIETQKQLSEKVLDIVGFDRNKGRLDTSHHPFCGGYPTDVRITTRYNENEFLSSVMAVLHESGHAMYEAALPASWYSQPVGQARGMSVHESQSLITEMQAGRNPGFIRYIAPILQKAFGGKGDSWDAENLVRLCNQAKPSFIRVDADEVTYPAHIILRYYIERYLIGGEMEVEDLPDAWAQGMQKFLGITPDTDANGCMQDIHWTDGSFGYFPTYTLGAIYAAQLFASAKETNGDVVPGLERGDFAPMITWLNEKIHQQGSYYATADDLITAATGKPLDVETYKAHLKARYLG